MFDFFKEAYLESKGLDVEKIKAEKTKKAAKISFYPIPYFQNKKL